MQAYKKELDALEETEDEEEDETRTKPHPRYFKLQAGLRLIQPQIAVRACRRIHCRGAAFVSGWHRDRGCLMCSRPVPKPV